MSETQQTSPQSAPVAQPAVPTAPVPVANATPAVSFEAAEAAAYEAAKAAIVAGETPESTPPAEGQQAPQQQTQTPTEQDPWSLDPAALAPKEPSIEEKIKARIAARKQQQQPQQPPPQQAPQQPITQANVIEYQRLMAEGKPNEALKALGSPHTLEDLQRAELKRLGVLKETTDPRVDEVKKKLEQFEQMTKQRETQEREAQARAQATAAYQADLQAVSREIVASGLPGAEQFINLPEVPAMVLQEMVQHEIGTLEAAKRVRETVRNLYNSLREVYEPSAQHAQAQAPVNAARPTPNIVPSGASATPVVPNNLSYDEAYAFVRQQIIEGKI